jgi:hypothetical protein
MTYENLGSERYKYRFCARAPALSRPTPPHVPPISPRARAAPPPACARVTVGVANHPSPSPLSHRHGALALLSHEFVRLHAKVRRIAPTYQWIHSSVYSTAQHPPWNPVIEHLKGFLVLRLRHFLVFWLDWDHTDESVFLSLSDWQSKSILACLLT